MHTHSHAGRHASAVLLALLLAASMIVVATPAQSHAAARTVVTAADPAGDVFLTRRTRITQVQKRSVDIRRTTVQRVDNRARIVIQIRDIMRVRKFDQMFFVSWREHPDTPGGAWLGDVGFTTKGRFSYASYYNQAGTRFLNCSVSTAIRPVRNEVVATVPWRCVPRGSLRISIDSYTGTFRSDAPWYSRDHQLLAGRHTVRPL